MNALIIKKHIKHIIKNTFGKNGLKDLKITNSNSAYYTNIYNFHGFLVRFFIYSDKNSLLGYSISILFYKDDRMHYIDIYNLNEKNIKKKLNFKYNDFNKIEFLDRIFAIKYDSNTINNFYKSINFIKNNLNFKRDNGNGYFHNYYEFKIEGIVIKNKDIETDLNTLINLDLNKTITDINKIKELNISNITLKLNK